LGLRYHNPKKGEVPTGKIRIYEPNGCKECMNTGYRGRIGVYEFMPITAKLREMIIARASLDDLKDQAISEGLITLRNAALRQVVAGVTSLDEAMRIT
jgi:type II secretory ATPase GspE/PulE/Tfp pilus assembly ATPase PilB-like protein